MKRILILTVIMASALSLTVLTSSQKTETFANQSQQSTTCVGELKAAFDYLNAVRANPGAFSEEIGVDLSGIEARPALVWDETLAKVAKEKANDMATRNYFGHVNPEGYGMNYFINKAGYTLEPSWVEKVSNNFFESLSAGVEGGKAFIIQLINDGGASNAQAGHRRHLLGMDDFWKSCVDIGIGRAYNENSTYRYYTCVIIAKHSF